MLKPMLRSIGTGGRISRIVSEKLGSGAPSAARIVDGESFRAPRALVFDLCEELAHEAGDLHLGLRAVGGRPMETLIEHLCTSAPTFGDAIAVWTRSIRLHFDGPIEIEEQARRIVVRPPLGEKNAAQCTEGLAAAVVSVMRQLTDENWAPEEIRFPHARPGRIDALEEVFRCPLRFDAPAVELVLAREDLTRPSRRSDPWLHRLLARFATEQLARVPGPNLVDQVRSLLLERLPSGNATLEVVADQLGMGVRTLQRYLEEEGTSFLAILDDARRRLATQLLRSGKQKLLEVALEVGFEDASSLHRAVRRWTGESPGRFRKGHEGV